MTRCSRRRVLQSVTLSAGVGLAGCNLLFYDGTEQGIIIAARRVEQMAEDAVAVVRFDELPESEQSFVRDAVESSPVLACEATDAMYDFASRVSGTPSYLVYDETPHELYVSIYDEVFTTTAPLPDERPDC